MSVMIPEEVATLAGGPEPIGPPGAPPMGPPAPPGADPMMGGAPPPGPPPGAGGLPPELAGLLGGGPEGTPPEGPPEEAGGGGSEVEILGAILEQMMEYLQVASDDIEKAKAMKAAQIVQDLLASNQRETESAAGIGPAQKGMAKALGGP